MESTNNSTPIRQCINRSPTLVDQTSPSGISRLKEKVEIVMAKLSNRVTDQDKVINLCQQNIRRFQEENLNLKSCIFELEGKMSLVKGVNEMSALKQQASDIESCANLVDDGRKSTLNNDRNKDAVLDVTSQNKLKNPVNNQMEMQIRGYRRKQQNAYQKSNSESGHSLNEGIRPAIPLQNDPRDSDGNQMEKQIREYRIKQQNVYENAQFNCNQEHDYYHSLKSNEASKYTQTEINHFHTNVENKKKYIAPVHVRKNRRNRSNKPKSVTQQVREIKVN